jgi:hypothetical protein
MTKKPVKRCSVSIAIRKMQAKTTTRITKHPPEWLKWKIVTIPNASKDAGKLHL